MKTLVLFLIFSFVAAAGWADDGGSSSSMSSSSSCVDVAVAKSCGAMPLSCFRKSTPLVAAVSRDDDKTARRLIENGADVLAFNNSKQSALMMAAYYKNEQMVRLLLEKAPAESRSDWIQALDVCGRNILSYISGFQMRVDWRRDKRPHEPILQHLAAHLDAAEYTDLTNTFLKTYLRHEYTPRLPFDPSLDHIIKTTPYNQKGYETAVNLFMRYSRSGYRHASSRRSSQEFLMLESLLRLPAKSKLLSHARLQQVSKWSVVQLALQNKNFYLAYHLFNKCYECFDADMQLSQNNLNEALHLTANLIHHTYGSTSFAEDTLYVLLGAGAQPMSYVYDSWGRAGSLPLLYSAARQCYRSHIMEPLARGVRADDIREALGYARKHCSLSSGTVKVLLRRAECDWRDRLPFGLCNT